MQFVGQFWVGAAAWPAVYQYATDDKAALADRRLHASRRRIEVLNHLQREENKRWDMGWVFTVIAGVLNLLVIYDAFAGPAFRPRLRDTPPDEARRAGPAVRHGAGAAASPTQHRTAVQSRKPQEEAGTHPVNLLGLAIYWHMPAIILLVSVVYSATRFDDWPNILRETRHNLVKISGFLIGIGLVLYALSTWI